MHKLNGRFTTELVVVSVLAIIGLTAGTAPVAAVSSTDVSARPSYTINSIQHADVQVSARPQVVVAAAPAPVAAPTAPVFTRNVWASGFQAQLNACRGAVNLTAAYGVATIGEKWGCGGSTFPAVGSLLRLTGLMSGTYRVGPVVAVLDAYRQTSNNIPRGYQLLYQTCRNDNAHTETFTQLTLVP